jgi:hypothetical protein
MKRIAGRVIMGLVVAVVALYVVDSAVLLVRMRTARQSAFSTVPVNQFIAIGLKGNKHEYDYTGTVPETCVRAIFPHASNPPCWWLKRHTNQWENVGALVGDSPVSARRIRDFRTRSLDIWSQQMNRQRIGGRSC